MSSLVAAVACFQTVIVAFGQASVVVAAAASSEVVADQPFEGVGSELAEDWVVPVAVNCTTAVTAAGVRAQSSFAGAVAESA